MTSSVQPCPYSWCSREETTPCLTSGATVTHFGPASTLDSGDDQVTVQLIGVPGHGADDDVYVEVTMAARLPRGGHRTASTFLTTTDTDDLVASLTAAARAAVSDQR